jgi:hypothetical protein
MTLSERADSCLASLDDAEQAIARRVFLRLASFGDDRAATHRPQPVSALQAGNDPKRFADTLRRLTEAQLLAVDGDAGDARVDLAHESLIASWPTLQAWIRAHGKTEQLRRQLEIDATTWSQRAAQGLDDIGLLDKGQLTELAAWLSTETGRDIGVSDAAESFIAASRDAGRGRWWPGKSTTGTVLAILLMLMLLATPIVLLLVVVLAASLVHAFG